MFAPATYQARRERLCRQVEHGLILIPGHSESPINYADNFYPFRQDSTFLYFAGHQRPDLALLVDADTGTSTLFGDDLSVEMIVWMGEHTSMEALAAQVGIPHTAPLITLSEILVTAQHGGRPIHYLPPYRADALLQLSTLLAHSPAQVHEEVSAELIRAVVAQRAVKSEEEIAEMGKAMQIAEAMHRAAFRETQPGRHEREVVTAVKAEAMRHGGRLGYGMIFSVHGETLHNHHYVNVMQDGDWVVNDSGADAPSGYASDITRTLPVSGRFSSQQAELYDLVLGALNTSLERLRPGLPFRDVHLHAARHLGTGLKALGLMRGDVDEAVAAGAHALFFPHGLGHMIGLDVHDMEGLGEDHVGYDADFQRSSQFGLRSLRLARPLAPGFALTVEPGLYFIPALIDQWAAEQKHTAFIDYAVVDQYREAGGVRLEDNVVITDTGYQLIGPAIPKSRVAVEAAMQAG